jgi:hypothetical protein
LRRFTGNIRLNGMTATTGGTDMQGNGDIQTSSRG